MNVTTVMKLAAQDARGPTCTLVLEPHNQTRKMWEEEDPNVAAVWRSTLRQHHFSYDWSQKVSSIQILNSYLNRMIGKMWRPSPEFPSFYFHFLLLLHIFFSIKLLTTFVFTGLKLRYSFLQMWMGNIVSVFTEKKDNVTLFPIDNISESGIK